MAKESFLLCRQHEVLFTWPLTWNKAQHSQVGYTRILTCIMAGVIHFNLGGLLIQPNPHRWKFPSTSAKGRRLCEIFGHVQLSWAIHEPTGWEKIRRVAREPPSAQQCTDVAQTTHLSSWTVQSTRTRKHGSLFQSRQRRQLVIVNCWSRDCLRGLGRRRTGCQLCVGEINGRFVGFGVAPLQVLSVIQWASVVLFLFGLENFRANMATTSLDKCVLKTSFAQGQQLKRSVLVFGKRTVLPSCTVSHAG